MCNDLEKVTRKLYVIINFRQDELTHHVSMYYFILSLLLRTNFDFNFKKLLMPFK